MIDASQIGSAKRAGHRDELQPSAAAARTRSRIGTELSSEMETELNCYSIAVGKKKNKRQQTCNSPHAFSESVHQ